MIILTSESDKYQGEFVRRGPSHPFLSQLAIVSTDSFAVWLPSQAKLALKGIAGIKAMSELALVFDKQHDDRYYKNISHVYLAKYRHFGISRDEGHAELAYDCYVSWTTLYSLYVDALLCFQPESDVSSSGT